MSRPATTPAPAGTETLRVLRQAPGAASVLNETRRRILEQLREPSSATAVARVLELPRQRVNYHIRELEGAGLVEEVGRRKRRGLEERLVRATARYWLISPEAIGSLGVDPERIPDRFSASYQVAVAARTITELGHLTELARNAGKSLPTMTLDTEVRFSTPQQQTAFAQELLDAVTELVAKYHDADSPDGRAFRVYAGAHPVYRQGQGGARARARNGEDGTATTERQRRNDRRQRRNGDDGTATGGTAKTDGDETATTKRQHGT